MWQVRKTRKFIIIVIIIIIIIIFYFFFFLLSDLMGTGVKYPQAF